MMNIPYVRYFNRRLAFSCGIIALSTFNYGFDNQAFATSQAMDAFDKQFGYYDSTIGAYTLRPYWLSLFNSLNYIGFAAGVLIGSSISARFGRRWCMFSMSCYALITATIAITSTNKDQIMAARILNYVYVGMELSVCPVFQSEIVPTPVRGMIVATYQFSLIIGGLINSICRGTSSLQDNRAWRIPIGLFYVVPSIIIATIWFIPESPRWLLLQNRHGEARKNLQDLRQGTKTDAEIDEEFLALRTTLENEPEQGKFWEMWKGINLKRTAIILLVNFFQQATGQAFASQYGTIYVKSLGTINPFDMALINSAVNGFCLMFSMLLVDKVGRKPLFIAGAMIQAVALIAMGGLGTASTVTDQMKTAIVAMLSIFSAGFSIGWAPLTYVLTTEIMALRLRDITARSAFLVNVVANFLVNFSIPYLIDPQYADLNSKVGFVFGSIAICAIVFTIFFVPECKGKSLEQIDLMFQEGVPLRTFGSYGKGLDPNAAVLAQMNKTCSVTEHHEKTKAEPS